MNARQKEQYLREYSILKNEGKSFFPYAVAKDGAMAVITMAVIILLALALGAELGPKADATTTSFVPRPEWYFFFLFELLRVVKPPALVFLATIVIPTICLVFLILLPFFDRGPERNPLRRPIASLTGVTVIAAMAYLTVQGALAGAPTEIDMKAPGHEDGKRDVASAGCLGCHKIGDNGNETLGPDLTHIGARLPRQGIARTLVNPTAPMPSFRRIQQQDPQKFEQMVDFLSSLK